MCWKWEIESLHWQTVCFQFKWDTPHEFRRDLYLIYSILSHVCAKSWSLPSVTVQQFPSLVNYFNALNSPPHPTSSQVCPRQQTVNMLQRVRERKTERVRERASSMNGGHSALHLPHSHRDPAWAGVSPQSGPVKSKPLLSQTLIPTRNTLLIPLCDPSIFYYCDGENG